MKILFLPNWRVHHCDSDTDEFQSPDKYIKNQSYWFFRHFLQKPSVDILDFQQPNIFTWLEKKINLYIWQGIKAFWVGHRYDVVISHGAQSGLVFSLLRQLMFRKPLHVIFDIGAMNGGRNNFLELAIIRLALLSKPWIICHSKVIIEDYRSRFPDLVNRSVYIPFGVDLSEFTASIARTDKETPYVLSFGSAKRDYDTLLNAWNSLDHSKYIPAAKLKIIGLAATSHVHSTVEFIEKVPIGTLKQEIARALFVVIPLPYFRYSYGQMSFLQSMALGKPVIVTKTPGSEDYLTEGEGAYLVPHSDAKQLAVAINRLLEQPDLMEDQGVKAQRHVSMNHNELQMARTIETFLNASLHQNAGK